MPQDQPNHLLLLQRFLLEHTDDSHTVSAADILSYWESYGIKLGRKSVYSAIEILQNSGMDIVCVKSTQNHYFVGTRLFELPELKLLVDAVESSRFITAKKSKQLIHKIGMLTSEYHAAQLNRHIYMDGTAKPENECIYYTVDKIQTAIQEKRKISFQYYEYTAKKEKVLKHDGYYDLHIAGPDGVIAPENSAGLFEHPLDQNFYERVTTIHLDALNTENVKDMNDMFSERTVLTELKLGPNFVTKNVTNMCGMFSRCYKLQKVDVSRFDTEHVTNMSFMFSECKALEGIDVSHFKTSRVESFRSMFYRCWKVKSLSLENFDTSSATSMSNMFGSSGLETLDLSSFDTRNVTYMSGMFEWSPLTEINFGENFDTSKVTYMVGMFKQTKLTSLRLPDKFVADSVENISEMFSGCERLRNLDLNNFHPTSKVTTIESVFSNCSSLKSLDLSSWDVSGVTKMTYAFAGTTGLTDLKIGTWRLKSVKEMGYAFFQSAISSFDINVILNGAQPEELFCAFEFSNIEHADLTGVDVSKVRSINSLFSNCKKLKTANLSNCNFASLTRSESVFPNCTALERVDLSNTKMPNITDMASWFGGCTNLTSVNFTGFVSEKCEKFDRMFFSCTSLTNVDFGSDFSFANGTGFNDMFNGCTSLKSVSGLNFNTSNKAAGFNNTFKGCSKLESVTFVLPERNASFPSLKTMTDMFDGCNQLTNVDFGGTWTVGDLTNTNRMFRNCTSLKNITLDFDEIRATQDGFFTTDMFTGVPADATLTTTVSMTNGLQAIRDAFDSRSTRAQTMDLPADLDEDLTEQWPADTARARTASRRSCRRKPQSSAASIAGIWTAAR